MRLDYKESQCGLLFGCVAPSYGLAFDFVYTMVYTATPSSLDKIDLANGKPKAFGVNLTHQRTNKLLADEQEIDKQTCIVQCFKQRESMEDYTDSLFLNVESDVFQFRDWFLTINSLRERLEQNGILTEMILKGYLDA